MGAEPPFEEQTQSESGGGRLGGKQYSIHINRLDVVKKGFDLFFLSQSLVIKNINFTEHSLCHMCKYPGGRGSRGSVCVCGG